MSVSPLLRPHDPISAVPQDTDGRPDSAAVDAVLGQLRDGARPARIDLRGAFLVDADLAGLDLSQADLSGANLSRADLRGANLMGARLRDAVLYQAQLGDAELTGADLTGANLERAAGERAGFGGASLAGVRLSEAQLLHCSFTQADLAGVEARGAVLRDARLTEASLDGADFTAADLRGAQLSHARVGGARFVEADLRGAHLTGMREYDSATWIGVDIRDINFTGAYLAKRHIGDENYLHEFRTRGRGAEWAYRLWWVTSDCGRSLGRWSLWVMALIGLFAVLYGAVGIDYGDYETALSPLYFSVVTMTTLGYGDVLPADSGAQLVAMIQVIAGYVMLGGLLSIFSTKMSRRSE